MTDPISDGRRCAGCQRHVAARQWCCRYCWKRLPERLRDAILAANGHPHLRKYLAEAERWFKHHPEQRLTWRQLQILARVADGLSNKEIAAELDLTLLTVKSHTSNIYKALGARSREHAVAIAYRTGIFDPVEPVNSEPDAHTASARAAR